MREIRLVAFFLLGVVCVALPMLASAATVTKNTMFSPPSVASSAGLPVSFGWDAVVPGTDWTYDPTPDGGSNVKRPGTLTIDGRAVPVNGARTLPPRSIAAAGRVLARVAGPVGLGMTLVDLYYQDGEWWKAGDAWQPPTDYPNASYYNVYGGPDYLNPGAACNGNSVTASYTGAWRYFNGDPNQNYIDCQRSDLSWRQQTVIIRIRCASGQRAITTAPYCENAPASEPTRATDQQLEDEIYVRLVERGMGSDLARRLIEQGYEIPDAGPETISGPESVEGTSSTTTTTGPAGTTTSTTTVTNNIQYGSTTTNTTVTVTQNTTTTTTAPDGTKTVTVKTDNPVEGKQQEQQTYTLDFQDSPFPEVPDLYEQKYPDGIGGAWDQRIAEMKDTSLFALVGAFTEGAPASGQCPNWSVNLNIPGMVALGTHDISPPCYVWPFVKACMVIMALFLARSMIFGG